mgnify:CR=1 FL=1
MPGWLQRLFARRAAAPAPLKGKRPVARVKSYTALSGYVYEYVYEGYREDADARTHVFTVSSDRKEWFNLDVAIPFSALAEWEGARGRTLNEAERYAVAKLALFAAFDGRDGPLALRAQPVRPGPTQIGELLDSIDF